MSDEKKSFLGSGLLSRGPDLLRPGSSTGRYGNGEYAFIVTKYPNAEGVQFHKAGAGTGHEHLITKPEILQGLFGPDLEKVLPEIKYDSDEYISNPDGYGYVPSGKKKTNWDHMEIRMRTKDSSVYGRYGRVKGRPVLMIWQHTDEDFDKLLMVAVKELGVPDDAVLTIGISEVGTLGDYLADHGLKKKALSADNQAGADMALRYHTATGAFKQYLAQGLKLKKEFPPYPDTSKMSPDEIAAYPWKRDHWRQAARKHGVPGVMDYGEGIMKPKLSFREWLTSSLAG